MPKLPVRIQGTAYGSQSVPTSSSSGQASPSIRQLGPSQPREQFADRQLNAIQRSVEQATSIAKANPMAQGNLLEKVTLASGDNIVVHGLGTAFRSAIVHGSDTNGCTFAVHRNSDSRLDAVQMIVNASAGCTVSIWVY